MQRASNISVFLFHFLFFSSTKQEMHHITNFIIGGPTQEIKNLKLPNNWIIAEDIKYKRGENPRTK